MAWYPVTDTSPPEYETVLTAHEDDLFPVCAFRIGGDWYREVEGPEDVVDRPGMLDLLYRAPTHWQPAPLLPLKTEQA